MSSSYPSLIPAPVHYSARPGSFILPKRITLACAEALREEGRHLETFLRRATGISLEQRADGGTILLQLEDRLPPEGYRLEVAPSGVIATASTSTGAFYAIQTLLQLFPPAIFGDGPRAGIEWRLPCCFIEDAPRFRWRGIMLDSARHFQPAAWVRKWIDLLAQHKFNRFHWHLTDHQGWRIEIESSPLLTEVGAWREGTARGHYFANADDDGERYGGYYTRREIADIVAYANERHITVIPEIEMPGHCQAALAAYPKWGASGEPLEVSRRWGGHPAIFGTDEATVTALQEILDEVIALFPSQYIHIGGDEADCTYWKASPAIRAQMRTLRLQGVKELHAWFIDQIRQHLARRGRIMVGWDEIAEGDLDPGSVVMAWRGMLGALQALEKGCEVVLCPHHKTYFDYYQSPDWEDEPLANSGIDAGYLDLRTVYDYEPIIPAIPEEQRARVLGVQGQLWTEYMSNPAQVEYMAFPRSSALAEIAWSPIRVRQFPDFQRRLGKHLRRLDAQGIRYRSQPAPPFPC